MKETGGVHARPEATEVAEMVVGEWEGGGGGDGDDGAGRGGGKPTQATTECQRPGRSAVVCPDEVTDDSARAGKATALNAVEVGGWL